MMTFYAIVRVIHKTNNDFQHSVQIVTDRREAQKRYYNVIATNENLTDADYHMTMWIDQNGNVLEKAAFDYTGNAGDMNA